MNDNSDDPKQVRGTEQRSLVERAAGRIAVDRARSRSAQTGVASDAPMVDADGAVTATQMLQHDETETARDREATLPLDEQHQGEVHRTAASTRERESKLVKIDLARLASRNLLTPQSKRSRTVEEFRLIKRRVLSRRWTEGNTSGNTIMVTSALPAEGKTTTAINLAMSIAAEEDLRVLLIDADFIKPDALRQLGVSADKGLIDVIQDPRVDISHVMLRTDIDKL